MKKKTFSLFCFLDLRDGSAILFETFGIQETDENYILLSSKG